MFELKQNLVFGIPFKHVPLHFLLPLTNLLTDKSQQRVVLQGQLCEALTCSLFPKLAQC